MSDLKDGLIYLNTLYPLTYVNMEALGTSLETVQSNLHTLAEIKTEGCICDGIKDFFSIFTIEPAYTLPTPPLPSGVITFGAAIKTATTITQPFSYSAGDATGFKYHVDGGSQAEAVSPIDLSGLTPDTLYTIHVAPYNDGGIGSWASTSVQTLPPPVAPQYFVVFQTPTVGITTISQPFTYEGADYDSFIATVNGVSIGTVTSPIDLTDLEEDTNYVITVTPVNTVGAGYTSQTTVHTNMSEETLITLTILNLEIEAYYAYGSDRDLLPTGYLYPTAYSEYLTNQARFNVFLGGVLIGELNLDNDGGATDVSPNFTALVPNWSGSSFSRYDTLTITLPQAEQIAAAITAAGVSLKFVPISTPSPHSSITARFTIKDPTGTVVSNVIHLNAGVSGNETYTLQIIE